ncbi:MAG TPA: transaldolase [Thermodesulfobacteriota bacterium]|nr:transaldolase [Thermodesulfobacteriota bacterium]
MKENPIKKLKAIRESIWLDNLSRQLMNSGELKRLINEVGVTGITSNPTIFQKAIAGSSEYDDSLKNILTQGVRDEKEIFLRVAIEDVGRAADMLKPVYDASRGEDGFVSIEVSPDLAYDTEKTMDEARRLFSALSRKNVLVKVPGTKEGLPAIENLTAEGINVNVTLLFSVSRYEDVMNAYLLGLEKRVREGKSLEGLFSVASFFVSRVDTLVDKHLEARLASAASGAEKNTITELMGKAAVANAKIAYEKYEQVFGGKRFRAIPGARRQKILWGSTGTKNPKYSDVKYVDELIGPDSINTIPDATLKAYADHGRTEITIHEGLEEAKDVMRRLKSVGVDIDQVTDDLEKEGVKLFSDSYVSLLKDVARKRDSL